MEEKNCAETLHFTHFYIHNINAVHFIWIKRICDLRKNIKVKRSLVNLIVDETIIL